MASELLSGEEEIVYGDSGYIGAKKRDDAITHNKHGKKINFNKYIDISTKSIVLDRITDETTGNYYENLPSDSELNTTNKTNSKTTSTELETNTTKLTSAREYLQQLLLSEF